MKSLLHVILTNSLHKGVTFSIHSHIHTGSGVVYLVTVSTPRTAQSAVHKYLATTNMRYTIL